MTDTILTLTVRPDWTRHAACRGVDPDLFFPERGQDTEPAKAVCRTCPVIDACLDHALRNGERVGVWGGTSERERRKMRQQWAAEHGIDLRAEMSKPIRHGEVNGYRYCRLLEDGPCQMCKDAWARYMEYRPSRRKETA